MHAVTLETRIGTDHRITIDLPETFPAGEVEVTVRSKTEREPGSPATETLIDFLDWLRTLPPSGRSKEEIDAEIAKERNAWGD